jgi:hypothetical protein
MTASTNPGPPPQEFAEIVIPASEQYSFTPLGYPIAAIWVKDNARSSYRRAAENAGAKWHRALSEAHWAYLGSVEAAKKAHERDRLSAEAELSEAMARVAELEAESKEPSQ